MIINRIRLSRFRKFRDRTLNFVPGLNVIKGPNEAGKSTLHQALRTALFEKPTATSQSVKAARTWGIDEMFAIGMEISVDDATYELDKDFSARKAVLSGGRLPEPIFDSDEIHRRLQVWLGCPSERFFSSTTCVAQDELAIRDRDKGEVAGRLQAVVAGGGADVGARDALKDLGDELNELARGLSSPAKNPGRILATNRRLEELGALRDQLAAETREVEQARRDKAEIGARRAEAAGELQIKSGLLEKNDKCRSMRQELEARGEEFGRRRHAKELHGELDALAKQEGELARLAEAESQVVELERRSRTLEEMRRRLEDVTREEAEAPKAPRPSSLMPILGTVLMIVAGAAGAVTAIWYVSLVATAVGAALVLSWAVRLYLWRRRAEQPDSTQVAALTSQIDSDASEIAGALDELGYGSIEEALQELGRLRGVRQERKEKEGELRGVAGGKSWEEFERETRGIADEIERKQEVLDKLTASELDPIEVERLRAEVEGLRKTVDELDERLSRVGYVLERSDVDADRLASVEDEITDLTETAATLEHLRKVYEATIEGIREAERETMVTATSALQKTVSERVARMTDGRYSEVEVDEKDLSMRVRSDEKGDWASVEDDLSRATRDQFYLSARLGLIDHLCGGAKPPLLLDDPFVTFDADRLARTMRLVKEMAAERQVLLFTCHEGYDSVADKVIDLGAPGTEAGS